MTGGINRLCAVSDNRAREVSGYQDNTSALGKILPDGSLKVDGRPVTLPKGAFLVCRTAKNGVKYQGEIIVKPLSPGDRVLVEIFGSEYVVVDVVVS